MSDFNGNCGFHNAHRPHMQQMFAFAAKECEGASLPNHDGNRHEAEVGSSLGKAKSMV